MTGIYRDRRARKRGEGTLVKGGRSESEIGKCISQHTPSLEHHHNRDETMILEGSQPQSL